MKSLGRWWQEWRFFVQEVSSPKPTSEIKDPGPFGRSLRQSPCLHTMHDPIVLELDTEATPLVSTSPLPHQTIECCEDDKLSLPLSRWIVPALACALAYALYNVSMPLSTYRGHFSHDSAVVFQQICIKKGSVSSLDVLSKFKNISQQLFITRHSSIPCWEESSFSSLQHCWGLDF